MSEVIKDAKMRERIGQTWLSMLNCQEGSKTLSDGSPAYSVEKSQTASRVVTIKKYKIKQQDKILEVGAGGGGGMKTFMNAGYNNITGITLGEGNVKTAKEKYNIDLLHMDMHFTTFPNETFDVILGWHVYEHTPCPLLAGLEFYRILKPGGKLLMEVPGGSHHFKHDSCAHHLNVLEDWQLKNLLRKSGFTNITVDKISENKKEDARLFLFYGEKHDINKDLSPHLKDVASGKFLN